MELLNLMLKYYINTGKRAAKLAIKNWSAMFAILVYSIVLIVTGMIASRISFLGGIIMALVTAACISSYLYIIQTIINNRIVNMNDFKNSFSPYLRRVLNVTFYIWIASIIYSLISGAILQIPAGWIVNLIINLAVLIMLNPLPEMIYMTYHSEMGIFKASFDFIKENYIEWLIPNIFLIGILYYLFGGSLISIVSFNIIVIVKYTAGLFFILFVMIYRGILFRFLNESTRRSRLFKLRML